MELHILTGEQLKKRDIFNIFKNINNKSNVKKLL